MAEQYFEVSTGYAIGNENTALVQILTGSGSPGGDTGPEDNAPIGSIFLDQSGQFYYKTQDTNDPADWSSPQAMAAGSTVTQANADNITTATTLDSVLVDDVVAVHWKLWVEDNATGASKRAIEIYATHNNIDGGSDASTADYNRYSFLRIGAAISGLTVDVVLAGATTAQTIGLQITSTAAVNARSARVDVLR